MRRGKTCNRQLSRSSSQLFHFNGHFGQREREKELSLFASRENSACCCCCSPPPGIGDRPKCDRGLVPCRLVGSASTVGWSGRAEVLRRRRSCRQHSRPHQPDSIDITALRHNLSLRLQLLSPRTYMSCCLCAPLLSRVRRL